jgi:hypothetical protein
MKTFAQFLFNNNAFIINSGLLKKKIWTGQLVRLLINSRIHIEFQAKLFIGIRNGLKTEMIKFKVNFFFVKLYPNGNYELLKG